MSPKARSPERDVLLKLFSLWGTLLFGGFVVGLVESPGRPEIPEPARLGSSLVLVVAGWVWYGALLRSKVAPYACMIAFGMTFGFIGDLFMAGRLPYGDSVMNGMTSFGVGHAAYLWAMNFIGSLAGLRRPAVQAGACLVWWLVGLVAWYLIVYPNAQPAALGWAALGYVILLATTAGLSSGLALRERAFWPLACGGALFFVSDLMIAAEKFGGYHYAFIAPAIWLTYGPAQMLIVSSIATAVRVADKADGQPPVQETIAPVISREEEQSTAIRT